MGNFQTITKSGKQGLLQLGLHLCTNSLASLLPVDLGQFIGNGCKNIKSVLVFRSHTCIGRRRTMQIKTQIIRKDFLIINIFQ